VCHAQLVLRLGEGRVEVCRGQAKGAGITDASLQKNLTGSFGVTTTNLNLAISSIQSSMLKTVINAIIAIPEIESHN
jgi:hypothetical protein